MQRKDREKERNREEGGGGGGRSDEREYMKEGDGEQRRR